MNMPSELKEAVAGGVPVEITEGTNRYVIISAEAYDRLTDIAEQLEVRLAYPHIARAFGPDGWDDPSMDIYNDLDPRKQ